MHALRELDDAARRAVTALGAIDGRRVVAEESLSVDTALLLHSRVAPGDVATLLTASELLASMPATSGLFADGVLSWATSASSPPGSAASTPTGG